MDTSRTQRKSLTILAALTLVLSACGKTGYDAVGVSRTDTGHKTADGRKFVVGNEERLEPEKIKITPQIPIENAPIKMTPAEEKKVEFHQTLKEFRFLRYDKESQQPERLGKDLYTFEILTEKGLLTFGGSLNLEGSRRKFSNSSKEDSNISIEGEIEDIPAGVVGKITLKVNEGGVTQEATILYRAYEANLNVHTPLDKKIEEHVNLQRKIETLKTNTKAWVNTFAVPYGVSTFDVAIIQKTSGEENESQNLHSLLQFSGRSVETDGESDEVEKLTLSPKNEVTDLKSIELVGNAEGEDSKIFSVTIKDDKGEDTEILIDVEREKTAEEIAAEKKRDEELRRQFLIDPVFNEEITPQPTPISLKVNPPQAPVEQKVDEDSEHEFELPATEDIPLPSTRPEYTPPKNPTPSRNNSAPSTSSVGNNQKSYMYARSGSKPLKVVGQFEQNFSLRGVQNEINKIKNSSLERDKLKKFFKFANPFRGLIERIAAGFDVPPQYAYVTLIESAYFYGGKYQFQVAGTTTASGPFQFVIGTARAMGMRVDSRQSAGKHPSQSDERRYFAPSACAAAKYFRNNINNYFSRDATLAITAYYQGEGRVANYAKRYGYNYSQLSRHNIKGISYTNKKLATYFIAGVYKGSNLDVDAESPRNLPSKSVFPSQAIKDSTCRNIVAAGS